MRDDQLEYYLRLGEVDRLRARPRGRLELLRTREIVEPLLPEHARVLDVGGGTGVHAGWLAEAGHDVLVIDPVPEQVALAAQVPGVQAVVGDARALDVPDASADAVLLLGPLYHLLERADRVRALQEAGRAVRPGGWVVGAVIPRSAVVVDMAARSRLDATVEARLQPVLATGRHDPELGFTAAYFHEIGEIAAEFAAAGLLDPDTDIPGARLAGVEGIGTHLLPFVDPAPPALWDSALRLARWSEGRRELIAGGSHVLALSRRAG